MFRKPASAAVSSARRADNDTFGTSRRPAGGLKRGAKDGATSPKTDSIASTSKPWLSRSIPKGPSPDNNPSEDFDEDAGRESKLTGKGGEKYPKEIGSKGVGPTLSRSTAMVGAADHGNGIQSARSNSLPFDDAGVGDTSPSSYSDTSLPRGIMSSFSKNGSESDLSFKNDDLLRLQEVCEDVKAAALSPRQKKALNKRGDAKKGKAIDPSPSQIASPAESDVVPDWQHGMLEAENAELSRMLAEQEAAQKDLTTKLEAAASREQEAEKLSAKLKAEIEALKKENVEIRSLLEAKEKSEADATSALMLQIAQLRDDKATVEAEKKIETGALQNEVAKLTKEIEQIEDQLATIQSEKDSVEEQLASVSLRAASAANGSLRVANDRRSLTKEMEELKLELAAAKAEIGALLDQKNALEDENWSQFVMRKWSGGVCGSAVH